MEKKASSKKFRDSIIRTCVRNRRFWFDSGIRIKYSSFNNVRIQNTSFKAYLSKAREQYGKGISAYLGAIWTYPRARIGTTIHNYGLPEHSEKQILN